MAGDEGGAGDEGDEGDEGDDPEAVEGEAGVREGGRQEKTCQFGSSRF